MGENWYGRELTCESRNEATLLYHSIQHLILHNVAAIREIHPTREQGIFVHATPSLLRSVSPTAKATGSISLLVDAHLAGTWQRRRFTEYTPRTVFCYYNLAEEIPTFRLTKCKLRTCVYI